METIQRTEEEMRLQRRFVRRAVLFSTLAVLALIAALAVYLRYRPAWLRSSAVKAMDEGSFARAETLLRKLDGDAEAEALLLECRYRAAQAVFDAGEYTEAKALFLELGDYGDSKTMSQACSYRLAEAVYDAGDYEQARDMFYALSGFSDSMERYDGCRYHLAIAACDGGDRTGALERFLELDDYRDARARAGELAVLITGISDVEDALAEVQGLTPEAMEERARLTRTREENPVGVLGVGFYHTVGLRRDGTLAAVGRNDEGQCDVSSWTDVAAVAAGAYHTVALHRDGTVSATGRNEEGQCDVGEWRNVVSVICTDYNTVARLSDGRLVSTGFQAYDMLAGWTDVTLIGGGSYIVAGVRANGQMVASHLSAQDETFADLVGVDASTAYAVGLCVDGSVQHTYLDLSDWSNVVCVEAASTGTFGLTADGKVLCAYFREGDALDLSDLSGAVSIAAGGTHVAVLLSDGSVVARGENGYGQCDTGSWDLS